MGAQKYDDTDQLAYHLQYIHNHRNMPDLNSFAAKSDDAVITVRYSSDYYFIEVRRPGKNELKSCNKTKEAYDFLSKFNIKEFEI